MPRLLRQFPLLVALLSLCIEIIVPRAHAASPRPDSPQAASPQAASPRAASPHGPSRYIITLQEAAAAPGDRSAAARSLATQLTARHGGTVELVYGSALFGFAATMTPTQAKAMANDPRVRAVEADAPVRTMQPGAK